MGRRGFGDGESETPLLTLAHDDLVLGRGLERRREPHPDLERRWDGEGLGWRERDALLTLTHDGPVWGAAWNGDGSRILTWSSDGTARVWGGREWTGVGPHGWG